jgi:uncharacterized protein (DUF342 family)
MNMTSHTRVVAAQAAQPVQNTHATFGIEFDDQRQLNHFNRLKNCKIKSKNGMRPYSEQTRPTP